MVEHPHPWAITVGVLLTSCGWWETYAEEKSHTRLGKFLWRVKERQTEQGGSRYFVYLLLAPLKTAVFLAAMVLISWATGAISQPSDLATHFVESFGTHKYAVSEVLEDQVSNTYDAGLQIRHTYLLSDDGKHAMWLLVLQICSSFVAYVAAKFTSKVQIQSFSFALPISMVTPACLALLLFMCGGKAADTCFFQGKLPEHVFFQCPAVGSLLSYGWESSTWVGLLWFLSYLWITQHLWSPKSPRLASTEQIFSTPYYEGLFLETSLMLNR